MFKSLFLQFIYHSVNKAIAEIIIIKAFKINIIFAVTSSDVAYIVDLGCGSSPGFPYYATALTTEPPPIHEV